MSVARDLLGIGVPPQDFTVLQVSVRAAVVFLYTILLVRFADKRFLSRKSVFDAALGFIIASMMARAINGSAPLVPTLVGGAVLILMHRALAHLAMRFHPVGRLVKGRTDLVVENGEIRMDGLKRNNFSQNDLQEDLRLNGVSSVEEVRAAYIERNGELSVLRKREG
jgi:uncharacterized membrane protein YcaP (DUF421 family)